MRLMSVRIGDKDVEVKLADVSELIINVNPNEIAIQPGYFATARNQKRLHNVVIDSSDSFKIKGVSDDGQVYVSELLLEDMPDDKWDEYCRRKDCYSDLISEESSDDDFGDIPADWKHKISY